MIDQRIPSISVKIDNSNPEYPNLRIFYHFSVNITEITKNEYDSLIAFPYILPITQEFIDKIPEKLKTWLLFS